MKIAVIGTINRDTIYRPDGSRADAYGGILFNLRTLARLFGDQARIYPVVRLGSDHAAGIREELGKLGILSLAAVRTVPGPNNHCTLHYERISEKSETLRGWVGAVDRHQLGLILGSDLVLVNFISGGDITRRNVIWLRRNFAGAIYVDIHSRTLGRGRDGRRFLRVPPYWQEYVAGADFLQLNQTEFQLLHGNRPTPETCRSFFLEHLKRCQALAVTIGESGCLLTYRTGKSLRCREIGPRRRYRAIDTTGCGDVFAGAFIYALARRCSLPKCARFAVDLATYASSRQTIDDLDFSHFRLP